MGDALAKLAQDLCRNRSDIHDRCDRHTVVIRGDDFYIHMIDKLVINIPNRANLKFALRSYNILIPNNDFVHVEYFYSQL